MSTLFVCFWVQSTGGVFFELPAKGVSKTPTANSAQTNRNIRHRRAMVIQRIFLFLITFSTLTAISPVVKTIKPHQYVIIYMPIYLITDWGGYLGDK